MVKRIDHKVNKQENNGSVLFLLLLAMAVSNVRLLGIYMLLAAGCLFTAIKYYDMKFPAEACYLSLFACLYAIFTFPHYGFVSAAKILVCPLIWLVGYNMSEAKRMEGIIRVVIALAFGMAIHALLNYLYNISIGTNLLTGRSNDIWSGELSATTGQAINYTLFTSISFWLIFLQKRKWLRVLSAGTMVCGVLHTIQMGNRSSLVLVMIAFSANVFALFVQRGKLKQMLTIVLAVALIVGIIIWMYAGNILDIRTYLEKSYLFYRIERTGKSFFMLTQNSRFAIKRAFLREMKAYMWGGGNLRGEVVGIYAHDLWLDVFDDGGILPFLVLGIYTILAFLRILKVCKDYRLTGTEPLMWLSYVLVIFAQFWVEPIWQGAPLLFCSFVIIDGMLAQFLRDKP